MRAAFAWILILLLTSVTAVIALPILGDQNFYSDDLAGHIALTLRMASLGGDPWFYDRAWFSGFPAFEFYGFLPHWIASALINVFGGGWSGATRSVHVVMAFSIAVLPLSTWWFVSAWQKPGNGGAGIVVGGIGLVLAIFLTFFNPGTIAGIEYIIVSGVFGQLPGWVLMFVYLGALGRANAGSQVASWVATPLFSLVLAAHPFTGVAALMAGALILLAHEKWWNCLSHVFLAVLTSAWFWLPFVAWSAEYGRSVPNSGEATVTSILFDRWLDLLNGIEVSGTGLIAEAFLGALVAYGVYQGLVNRSHLGRSVILLLGAALALAGTELAEAIPLSLHYDRLIVTLSLLLALLAAASVQEIRWHQSRYLLPACAGILLGIGASLALQVLAIYPLPNSQVGGGLNEEKRLLSALDSLEANSRIYFELPRRLSDSEFAPGKFVESKLWHMTGIETVNGVLIQSSRTYQLYATVLKRLRAWTFSSPSIAWNKFQLRAPDVVDVLRRNSITHVISSNEDLRSNLEKIPGMRIIGTVGRYTVHAINGSEPRLRQIEKPLVGYLDLRGTLPFRYMDAFIETREMISGRVRLVALRPADLSLVNVDGLILNLEGREEALKWRWMNVESDKRVPMLRIHFKASAIPKDEARTRLRETRRYDQIADYLIDGRFERQVRLFADKEVGKADKARDESSYRWSSQAQEVEFDGLSERHWYEFAYSAFPAWEVSGGILREGSAGHWYLWPDKSTMVAEYNRWSTGPVLMGWAITLAGVLLMVLVRFWSLKGSSSGAS